MQDYNIWFGKRLKEAMDHRGLTAKGLGEMSGIGRMTISRIVNGRYATVDEVRRIADALGVSTDRLRQKDVDLKQEADDVYVRTEITQADVERAHKWVEQALGKTEIGYGYLLLCNIYELLSETEQKLTYAKRLFELWHDHEEPDFVAAGYLRLLKTYWSMKDAEPMFALLEEVRPLLDTFGRLEKARLQHFFAIILVLYTDRLEEAAALYEEVLPVYDALGETVSSAYAFHNLTEVEFRRGRYEESLALKEVFFQKYPEVPIRWHALSQVKDLAKVLLCLGAFDRAKIVIEKHLDEVLQTGHERLAAVYLMMHALVTGEEESVRRLKDYEVDERVKLFVLMMESFAYRGDAKALEKLRDYLSRNGLFDLENG